MYVLVMDSSEAQRLNEDFPGTSRGLAGTSRGLPRDFLILGTMGLPLDFHFETYWGLKWKSPGSPQLPRKSQSP